MQKTIHSLEHESQRDFIRQCLIADHNKRPRTTELLFHKVLFEVHSLKLLAAHSLIHNPKKCKFTFWNWLCYVSFLIYCSIFFFSFLVFSSLLLASSPLDHWFTWCLHLLSCVILVGTAYVYYFFYWSQEAWQYWWWLANLINIISSSPPIQCNISYHQPVKYILTSVNHPWNTLRSAMEYKPCIFLLFNSQQEHWQLCWRNAAAPVPSGQHLGWD